MNQAILSSSSSSSELIGAGQSLKTRVLTGSIAEILGIHIGLIAGLPPLTIPGFFFELVLPFWLIIKGFQPAAYGQDA